MNTIRHAIIGQLRNPSPGFEDAIRMHFYLKKERVLKVWKLSWIYFYFFRFIVVSIR